MMANVKKIAALVAEMISVNQNIPAGVRETVHAEEKNPRQVRATRESILHFYNRMNAARFSR